MPGPAHPSRQPRINPPLRLDSSAVIRHSIDTSPSRSSIQSSREDTPSSSVSNTPVVSTRAPSPEKKPLHPGNSSTFLTALAAQERQVLELKEELQKAEGELGRLKKQWASHEAAKKRDELRHLEQLQPIKSTLGGLVESPDQDSNLAMRDVDRRIMAAPTVKPSKRTVFSGSRHTRTLSLLSPSDTVAGSSPPACSAHLHIPDRGLVNDAIVPTTIYEPRTSTDGSADLKERYEGPPKDMILETGKQLVGDFRQGLWTFFEDLRQVTVGDEAAGASNQRYQRCSPTESIAHTRAKRDRVSTTKSGPVNQGEIVDSEDLAEKLETENSGSHGPVETHKKASLASPLISTSCANPGNTSDNFSESDDGQSWVSWDAMTPKHSAPSETRDTSLGGAVSSPSTDKRTPRTSLSSIGATSRSQRLYDPTSKQDDVPWPPLTRLSPGRLAQTASTLMGEWEKSLTAPANQGASSISGKNLKGQKVE